MAMEQDIQREAAARYARLVADAWTNDELRDRLLADPAAVLRERGFSVPEGAAEIRVVEGLQSPPVYSVFYFVLPPRPPGVITDEEVERVARENLFYTFTGCTVTHPGPGPGPGPGPESGPEPGS